MSYVITVRRSESEKFVSGRLEKVVPFMGADREGEFAQMGIGLITADSERAMFWGLGFPRLVIQSWRGVRVLGHIKLVDSGTLCACWYAGAREVNGGDERYLEDLAGKLGGMEKLQAIRNEALASAPTAEELGAMITTLREKGVDVDSRELEEEAQAGHITMTPLIETLVREAKERRQEYERQEAEIKKPLPREESLGAFFGDMGIGNFISGDPWDWEHIKLDELNAFAKRNSFLDPKRGHRLQHTTQEPKTVGAKVAPGVILLATSSGEIESPWVLAADGTQYAFTFANFRDGRFFITTKVSKPGKDGASEGEYALDKLREMIGPLPQPTTKRSLRERFAALFS